jgi:type IV pilus assembly protein PilV
MRNKSQQTQRGFSLIEVMVTAFILAIGVLGVSGLQLYGLRESEDIYYRTQADALITSLAERMRSNMQAARKQNYYVATALPYGTPLTCASCAADQQTAVADLNQLSAALNASGLPGAKMTISQVDATNAIYDITVGWNSRINNSTRVGTGQLACSDTTFTTTASDAYMSCHIVRVQI